MMRGEYGLSVREKILNDCRQIAAFARPIVEADIAFEATGEERNERLVIKSLEGARQSEILRLLNIFIDHLGEVRSKDDLPGDCPESRDLRNYVLAALGAFVRRVGDPAGFARLVVLNAQRFLDGLIVFDPYVYNEILTVDARKNLRTLLRYAAKIGNWQLTKRWFNTLLADFFKGPLTEPPVPKATVWTLRQRDAVEAYASSHGITETEAAGRVWAMHADEYNLVARFPSYIRGYASADALRRYFARHA